MVDDGVVIDVRPMKDIEIDVEARVARVGAGVTWGELDAAAQEHGLATTGGRVSTTGVAGFTIGGGSGWLERSYGLACDNLLGATMVTADGERRRVRARPSDPTCSGRCAAAAATSASSPSSRCGCTRSARWSTAACAPTTAADGREVARAFRDFHQPGPDEAGLGLVYLYGPPEEFIPPEWQGKLIVAIAGCWNGPVEEGEAALQPLLDVAEPIVDLFGPMPYVRAAEDDRRPAGAAELVDGAST